MRPRMMGGLHFEPSLSPSYESHPLAGPNLHPFPVINMIVSTIVSSELCGDFLIKV